LLAEELTKQSYTWRAMQLLPGENNSSSDHPAQTGRLTFILQITTCPVDRRNQILFTSQSPGKTTSECLLDCQYHD
jgi:hypothetical protein